MAALATAFVRVLGDTKGLKPSVVAGAQGAGAGGGAAAATGFKGSFLGGLRGIAGPLAAILGATAIFGFFKDSITAARDLGESVNAVQVVFGDAAAGILKLSKDAATGVGLSKTEFNGLAVQFSAFAKTIAGEGGNVTGTIDDITTRAADFASVMNIDVAKAAELFQSGLAGETEPLRRFGIDLSAAAVKAHAYETGLADAGAELTEQQKVQARYSLLLEQTNQVQGDFANTSDSLANRQRILGARWENLQATLGKALLPAITAVVTAVDSFIAAAANAGSFISENIELFAALGAGILAVALPAIVSLVVAFGAWAVAAGAAAIATLLAAAPIILIGAAVAGLAFLIIKNWDTIKAATVAVWDAVTGFIRRNWQIILAVITGPIGIIVALVIKNWDTIKAVTIAVWNAVRGAVTGAVGAVVGAVTGAWSTVRSATSTAWNAVRDLVAGAWIKIRDAAAQGAVKLVTFVQGIPTRLLRALSNLGSLLFQAGRDVLRGLVDGIASFVGNAIESAKDAVGDVVGGVKSFFGIGSPSRLTHAEIGVPLAAGVIGGFIAELQAGARDIETSIRGAFALPAAGRLAGAAVPLSERSPGPTFNIHGTSEEMIARIEARMAYDRIARGRP